MNQEVRQEPTDKEINDLADWIQSLTFEQLMFLKKSYEEMLESQAHAHGNGWVQ